MSFISIYFILSLCHVLDFAFVGMLNYVLLSYNAMALGRTEIDAVLVLLVWMPYFCLALP